MDKGWYKILAPVSIIYSLLHKKHHTTLWTKKKIVVCLVHVSVVWAGHGQSSAESLPIQLELKELPK